MPDYSLFITSINNIITSFSKKSPYRSHSVYICNFCEDLSRWDVDLFLFAGTFIHNQRIHTVRKCPLGILWEMHPYPISGISYPFLEILYIHFLYFFHVLLPSRKKDSYKPSSVHCPLAVIMTVHFSFCCVSDCAGSAPLLVSWQAFFCYAQ